MKLFAVLAAVLTGAMSAAALPASAADDPAVLTPAYPLDQAAAATLTFEPLGEGSTYRIRILQSSEERDSLVYCTADLTGETRYTLLLEPGSYLLEMGTPVLTDGVGYRKTAISVTIDNPDYDETLDYTELHVLMTLNTAADTAKIIPSVNMDAPVLTDGIRHIEMQSEFFHYDRIRGDFDGDGSVTTDDVLRVLREFTISSLEPDRPDAATPAQITACDINDDKAADTSDAILMLRYITLASIGADPDWTNLTAN